MHSKALAENQWSDSAVDAMTKQRVLHLITKLAEQGRQLLMITEEDSTCQTLGEGVLHHGSDLTDFRGHLPSRRP
jgi:ABC-type histidine transport system ATPase subunit